MLHYWFSLILYHSKLIELFSCTYKLPIIKELMKMFARIAQYFFCFDNEDLIKKSINILMFLINNYYQLSIIKLREKNFVSKLNQIEKK